MHFAVESTLSQSQEADFKTPAEVVEKYSTGRISPSYIFHRTSLWNIGAVRRYAKYSRVGAFEHMRDHGINRY